MRVVFNLYTLLFVILIVKMRSFANILDNHVILVNMRTVFLRLCTMVRVSWSVRFVSVLIM